MEVTVSVSTVMLCNGTSALLFEAVVLCLIEVVDCLAERGGGATPAAPDRISVLMLPFSLPLSFAGEPAFSGCEVEVSEMMLSSSFSDASSKPWFGEASGLASWTVSRVDGLAPGPRAGVLIPDGRCCESSDSKSVCSSGEASCGEGVDRWTLMTGVSCSPLRGGGRTGLWRMGGGDRNRGETGHRGVPLSVSVVPEGFCGPAALVRLSVGAGRMGVVAADKVLAAVAAVGRVDLVGRVGLRSC